MTIKKLTSKAAALPAAAGTVAGRARRRLILLASVVLVLTDASTFRYTGTRTFVAANGGKLFSAITGSGTFTRTTAHSTETDTITGGTGRFAGASVSDFTGTIYGYYGDTSASGSPAPPRPLAGR
jgi:hypothetical protein